MEQASDKKSARMPPGYKNKTSRSPSDGSGGDSKESKNTKDSKSGKKDKATPKSPAGTVGKATTESKSAERHKLMGDDYKPQPKPAPPPVRQEEPQAPAKPYIASAFALDSGREVGDLQKQEIVVANGSNGKDDEKKSTTTIPFCTKIVYCLPTVSTLPIIVLLAAYGNSLYELCGADLSLISACIAGARSLDVITDPGMSYITDACQSRWGRRKPFLASGCWVYGLALFLLLYPPYGSSGLVGAWFGMMYILYFLTNTYTTIPYDALAPELTDDSDDRARLFFISGIFDGLGTLTAVGMPAAMETMASSMSVNDEICKPSGSEDNVDLLCQLGNTCEEFISDRSKPFVLWDRHSISDITWLQSYNLTNLTSVCDEAANIQNYYVDLPEAHADFCICRRDCASACNLANKRTGFALVGALFGIYFILTIIGVVGHVKERKPQAKDNKAIDDFSKQATGDTGITAASNKKENPRRSASIPVSVTQEDGQRVQPPIVPLLMTTLFNKAAWACDGMVNAVVAALLTYYIRYVVAPEYQTLEDHGRDCAKGVNGMSGADNYSAFCSTEMVLAGCCCALFVFAAAATPVWLLLMSFCGKVNTWLMWSCIMAITNILLVLPGKGDIYLTAIVCGLNGLPLGAKFLADAILADIIDYDEFLTGSRREATYTMFKSFLPKIMAIPSIAIPISLMNVVGHVPPKNGLIQEQPDSVPIFIKIVGAGLTCVVSIVAFLLKRRFPLKTQQQVEEVALGIEMHKKGLEAKDPVSGLPFMYTSFDVRELPFVWDLDHFMGSSVIEELKNNFDVNILALKQKMTVQLASTIVFSIVSLILTIVALTVLDLMSDDKWSFIPTLLIVSVGMSFVVIVFSYTRFNAARNLCTKDYHFEERIKIEIRDELLARIITQRKNLEALQANIPKVKSEAAILKDVVRRASTTLTDFANGPDAKENARLPKIQVGNSAGYKRQKDTPTE